MPAFGPKFSATDRRRAGVRFNTDPVIAAVADGLFAVAVRIGEIASSRAPDDEPRNVGLPQRWAAGAWALGRLLEAQTGDSTDQTFKKPRSMRTSRTGADAVVGFGFPARFQEVGTVHQPARPFFGPAAVEVATGPEFRQIIASHFPKGGTR